MPKETVLGQGEGPRAEAAPGYRTDSLMRLKRMQKQRWMMGIAPVKALAAGFRAQARRLKKKRNKGR